MICKWCRRPKGEHERWDFRFWCHADDEPICTDLGDQYEFTPDESPTGKLLAAALEDVARVREWTREGVALDEITDMLSGLTVSQLRAFREIHEAENGGGDETEWRSRAELLVEG